MAINMILPYYISFLQILFGKPKISKEKAMAGNKNGVTVLEPFDKLFCHQNMAPLIGMIYLG